jgi:hypothetical protein
MSPVPILRLGMRKHLRNLVLRTTRFEFQSWVEGPV